MTFDEIQNCTFQPMVGSRIPERYFKVMKKIGYNLPNNFEKVDKSYADLLDKNGELNMGKNKELVRLGKLNKSKFLLKQGIFKYEDVYKIICENFNVT